MAAPMKFAPATPTKIPRSAPMPYPPPRAPVPPLPPLPRRPPSPAPPHPRKMPPLVDPKQAWGASPEPTISSDR